MKGTSSVANMIDKVFIAALTSQRSGGPASKHHNPRGSQASHHPCFVLQLSCPPENFDVLSEPNKCKAVFSDPSRVKICVKKLLLKMFEIYRPDLFASAESLCSDYSNSPSTLYRHKGIDTHIQETENDNDHETNDGGIKMITSDVSTKLYNVRTNDASDSGTCTSQYSRRQTMTPDGIVFKSAFLETPPDKNFTKGNFHVQPVSLFSEFEYNGCTMESAIQAQDLSEYVDNQADSTDSDEANMDNHEKYTPVNDIDGRLKHPEITGIGVTVSRLPGFLEYIDDQLDNFGSQSTTGSADKLFQHEEVNDIYANKDYLSQIEFPSDYEDLHDKRGGIDYDSPDSQRYSDNNQRSVQRDNLFCEFPDDDRINSDQSKNQDFYDVSSLNYENSPFDINPVQSVPTVNPAYIRDIGSSIETSEPPTPEVLNVHSDCRINLHNHVFDDLFFSAYLDRSALMPEPVRADIIAKKKKRVGVPLGTRRSAVGEWEMKSTDCISSILDRDFDVSPGNANNTWEAILAPATVTTAITLQKGMLSNLRTIGQVDSKYLLVVSGQLILIVDQHAADERVKLEQMLYGNIHGDTKKTTPSGATNGINNATITSISGTQAVKETMSLTESDLYTLTTKEEIFTDWKFIFSHSNSLQGTDTTEDQMITVTLTQVPIIYGEALTAQDFLEFLHSLTEQSKFMAPRSMLQPPCVKRIAASKACRTAIVFGDVLNRTECQNIMSNLSKTALPFQCAHGRPSAVPLLLLKQVEDSRKDESGSAAGPGPKLQRTPTYSNIINKNRQKNS